MSAVDLQAVKDHSVIETSDFDSLLQAKIDAAEDWIGSYLGVPISSFDTLPNPIREAVLQLVAAWYEQREAVIITGGSALVEMVPFSVYELLAPYRVWTF